MPGIRIIVLATLALGVAFLSLAPTPAHAGLVFTVNSTGDTSDANPGDGLCDDGSGVDGQPGSCTLRAAIEEANANAGADTIAFEIVCIDFREGEPCLPSQVQTIAPASELPGITDPVTIDGTTQPGFSGTPIIELSGDNAGEDTVGMGIVAGETTIRGLVINRFDSEGIVIFLSPGGAIIEGNFIGTDMTGTVALGNSNGVLIFDSENVLIGGTTATARNVISGNRSAGVFISDGTGNRVEGNYIGTDVTGTSALGNAGGGVFVNAPDGGNTIGGTAPGAGNVISGNGLDGVVLNFDYGTAVQGNLIGTTADGTAPLGNNGNGVVISSSLGPDGAGDHLIGGTTTAARNVISANAEWGVFIAGSSGDIVQGNYIGTDITGTADLGNAYLGLFLYDDTSGILVGGPGAGNVISGNGSSGVAISGDGNRVEGNLIGTDASGQNALGNAAEGVFIGGSGSGRGNNNVIGGRATGTRNIISGNGGIGVYLVNTRESRIEGNYIGTDITGTVDLGNKDGGVVVESVARGNWIGGPGVGNVISGNDSGVLIFGTENHVEGNLIGTDASGRNALGNDDSGVVIIGASGEFGNNLIGGQTAASRNVISGNGGDGIQVGRGEGNRIEGNYIGTDITGTHAVPNGTGVVIAEVSNNTIGGTAPGAANIIAFNIEDGVLVGGADATGNTVRGNSIHSNGSKGIENVSGGNSELPPPVITSAGSASGTACAGCIVDLYSDDEDEGHIYHGSTIADGSGNWSFPNAVLGPNVTAAATDANGSTSEFSAPFNCAANGADIDGDGLCDSGDPTPLGECAGVPVTIRGSDGSDALNGTSGADVIHGAAGDDLIQGRDGSDIICGGEGDDLILGKHGNDSLYGEAGNDDLNGGKGSDTLDGGPDADRCNGSEGLDSGASCEVVAAIP